MENKDLSKHDSRLAKLSISEINSIQEIENKILFLVKEDSGLKVELSLNLEHAYLILIKLTSLVSSKRPINDGSS